MSLPKPEVGLVIRYSYLWHAEHLQGREEGVKDRPCAIVVAVANRIEVGRDRVWVLPVTHSAPVDADGAIEIPAVVKNRLGLDGARSWIILTEWNEFLWPGPDLRRASGQAAASVAYGYLPPNYGNHVRAQFAALVRARKAQRVARGE